MPHFPFSSYANPAGRGSELAAAGKALGEVAGRNPQHKSRQKWANSWRNMHHSIHPSKSTPIWRKHTVPIKGPNKNTTSYDPTNDDMPMLGICKMLEKGCTRTDRNRLKLGNRGGPVGSVFTPRLSIPSQQRIDGQRPDLATRLLTPTEVATPASAASSTHALGAGRHLGIAVVPLCAPLHAPCRCKRRLLFLQLCCQVQVFMLHPPPRLHPLPTPPALNRRTMQHVKGASLDAPPAGATPSTPHTAGNSRTTWIM
jgi:hypothetical protein